MNKLLLVLGAAAIITACTKAPEGQNVKAEEKKEVSNATGADYIVDTKTSTVKWTGTKVSGKHTGTVAVKEGKLTVADGNIVSGNFVMDMNTITNTDMEAGKGKEKLEGHLKDVDFFDVKKFADSKFEITKCTADTANGGSHKLEGNLTIKDKTKSISFNAKVTIGEEVKASAIFNINREDWDLKYPGKKDDAIRKEINYDINLVATKSK